MNQLTDAEKDLVFWALVEGHGTISWLPLEHHWPHVLNILHSGGWEQTVFSSRDRQEYDAKVTAFYEYADVLRTKVRRMVETYPWGAL